VLPPADYVIQKSKRSEPFVVHADKLKHCYSDTPTSALELTGKPEFTETATASPAQPAEQLMSGDSADTSVERPPKSQPKRKTAAEQPTDHLTAELDAGLDIEVGPEQMDRPRRQHRVPKRLEGYRLYRTNCLCIGHRRRLQLSRCGGPRDALPPPESQVEERLGLQNPFPLQTTTAYMSASAEL